MIRSVHRESSGDESSEPDEVLFLREGRTGVISVMAEGDGTLRLQNNGLSESVIDLDSTPPTTSAEELLRAGALRSSRRSAHTCFVVGLGGGETVRALTRTDLERIRVVEIEPVVVEAVTSVLGARAGLEDHRVEVNVADARNTLLLEESTYDLIVSQPSHPWLAGASLLFTREFFQLAKRRLNEGGVFSQWLNLFRMDATTLRSILATFFDVFPHGFTLVRSDTGDLLLLGSAGPTVLRDVALEDHLRRVGAEDLTDTADVIRWFGWSRREAVRLSAGSPLNTDRSVRSETRLASLTSGRTDPGEDPYELLRETITYDVLPFLEEDSAARILTELGNRLVRDDDRLRARILVERLTAIDPRAGDELDQRLRPRGSRADSTGSSP